MASRNVKIEEWSQSVPDVVHMRVESSISGLFAGSDAAGRGIAGSDWQQVVSSQLPALIENGNKASMHFYFGNMTAMRKYLAPSLVNAYEYWHEKDDISLLDECLADGKTHWHKLADDINQTFKSSNNASLLEALIKERTL